MKEFIYITMIGIGFLFMMLSWWTWPLGVVAAAIGIHWLQRDAYDEGYEDGKHDYYM